MWRLDDAVDNEVQMKNQRGSPLEDSEAIFREAVASVDPSRIIENAVAVKTGAAGEELVVHTAFEEARCPLAPGGRIFVLGMGKASARMAAGLEAVLGDRIAGGLVVVKQGFGAPLHRVRIFEAGHPVPDERSVRAADMLLHPGALFETAIAANDIFIVLVSGGGSAILCAPSAGLSLEDKISATRLLLASGATINEMNCVRKHISAIKGGQLAAALAPATVLTLVISDVVGDDIDVIASGPTVPDPTRFADALAVIHHYDMEEKMPSAILDHLHRGAEGQVPETPKPDNPVFLHARTILVGTNRIALEAAGREARLRGYNSMVLSSRVTGEAREAALFYFGIAKDMAISGFPVKRPACLVAGGETTVTLRGTGRGGRNQEMALAFLVALGESPKGAGDIVFLSAGTDGNDGPTDAAGAVVSLELYDKARRSGLDPGTALAENDAYTFFSSAGGLLKTGFTGTNVCDIQVILVP